MINTNERHAVAESKAMALAAAKEYLQGAGPWKIDEIGIDENDYLVGCFHKAIIAAEAAQRERDAQLIEADAKLCDCSARSEGECACGAWCEWKSITSARAAEIIRKQST